MIEPALIKSIVTIVQCRVPIYNYYTQQNMIYRSGFNLYKRAFAVRKKNCDFIMMREMLLLFLFFFCRLHKGDLVLILLKIFSDLILSTDQLYFVRKRDIELHEFEKQVRIFYDQFQDRQQFTILVPIFNNIAITQAPM